MATVIQWPSIATGLTAASLLTLRAWRKKSLTTAGCAAAWFVGYAAAASGPTPFSALLFFFLSSTFVTKIGAKRKAKLEKGYAASGNRSAWQVLANGAAATALLFGHMFLAASPLRPRLDPAAAADQPLARAVIMAVVAHYAACQGDTWSSEIGVLSASRPRLILGFRSVTAGTNGGVSLLGSAAAAGAGLVLGGFLAAINVAFPTEGVSGGALVTVSVAGAVGGTMVDSVLGQFGQYSGVAADGVAVNAPGAGVTHTCGRDVLSNNAVNFLTATAAAAAAFYLA